MRKLFITNIFNHSTSYSTIEFCFSFSFFLSLFTFFRRSQHVPLQDKRSFQLKYFALMGGFNYGRFAHLPFPKLHGQLAKIKHLRLYSIAGPLLWPADCLIWGWPSSAEAWKHAPVAAHLKFVRKENAQMVVNFYLPCAAEGCPKTPEGVPPPEPTLAEACIINDTVGLG